MVLLKRIKSYFVRKEIEQLSKKKRSFPLKVESILLFLDAVENPGEIEKKIRGIIQKKWPNVKTQCVFFSSKKRNKNVAILDHILYSNDFNLFSNFKHRNQKEILIKPYDLLINLSETKLPQIEKCLLKSKAKYNIGPGGKEMYPFHDFMVNAESKLPEKKLETILLYLV